MLNDNIMILLKMVEYKRVYHRVTVPFRECHHWLNVHPVHPIMIGLDR